MKSTLTMLVAVVLMAAGCTSRTYVNRTPGRHTNQYGRSDRNRYDHNRDNTRDNSRYDRNRGW